MHTIDRIHRWLGSAASFAALLGGLAILLAMGLLTCVDIVLRQFGGGVSASWEIVTLSMRAMIGLAMPYAFFAGRHIAVEIFTDNLPEKLKLAVILLGQIVSMIVMGVLGWRMWVRSQMILSSGSTTADLGISEFFHWLPLMAGAGLSVLVLSVSLLRDAAILAGHSPATGKTES